MATFKEDSRYRGSTVTQVDNKDELTEYVVLRKPLEVPLTDGDKYIIIDEGNQFRPDILSDQVYGSTRYDWALMEINGIRNFAELQFGIRLRVPPLDEITSRIEESNSVV
jgi:hypothetical protein